MNWRIRKAHSRGNAIVVTHALRLRRWSPFAKWTDERPNVSNCAESPANLLQITSVSLVRHRSVKKPQLVITHTRSTRPGPSSEQAFHDWIKDAPPRQDLPESSPKKSLPNCQACPGRPLSASFGKTSCPQALQVGTGRWLAILTTGRTSTLVPIAVTRKHRRQKSLFAVTLHRPEQRPRAPVPDGYNHCCVSASYLWQRQMPAAPGIT